MMRKPSEYIAAAVRNVRDRLMDDCRERMTHGDRTAMVTRASSFRRGEDEVSDFGATEAVRVLALASDFPDIDKGVGVTLGDTFRVVTSVRTDCAGASKYVGLSYPFEKFAASVSGKRGANVIHTPVMILAVSNGKQTEYADGYAPVEVYSWTVAIHAEEWLWDGEPQIGDEIRFDNTRLKVAKVTALDGLFILNARSR